MHCQKMDYCLGRGKCCHQTTEVALKLGRARTGSTLHQLGTKLRGIGSCSQSKAVPDLMRVIWCTHDCKGSLTARGGQGKATKAVAVRTTPLTGVLWSGRMADMVKLGLFFQCFLLSHAPVSWASFFSRRFNFAQLMSTWRPQTPAPTKLAWEARAIALTDSTVPTLTSVEATRAAVVTFCISCSAGKRGRLVRQPYDAVDRQQDHAGRPWAGCMHALPLAAPAAGNSQAAGPCRAAGGSMQSDSLFPGFQAAQRWQRCCGPVLGRTALVPDSRPSRHLCELSAMQGCCNDNT